MIHLHQLVFKILCIISNFFSGRPVFFKLRAIKHFHFILDLSLLLIKSIHPPHAESLDTFIFLLSWRSSEWSFTVSQISLDDSTSPSIFRVACNGFRSSRTSAFDIPRSRPSLHSRIAELRMCLHNNILRMDLSTESGSKIRNIKDKQIISETC